MKSKVLLIGISLVSILLISACNKATNTEDAAENLDELTRNTGEKIDEKEENIDHGSYHIPEGLKEAENPKFPVGSKAIVNASHTDGMEGAEATIKAAYDTKVYSVTYNPTNGDPIDENHKWFVEGEIALINEADEGAKLEEGANVIIEADHQPGMLGAEGYIETIEETTVYVVDYVNSLGETVEDHLWLKESELAEK